MTRPTQKSLNQLLAFLNFYQHTKNQSSQICSNDHFYKTTTFLRQPMQTLPKQVPIQLLLYKTTICLTRPATTFLVPQMKKTCLKPKFYPANKWETNIWESNGKATMGRQPCIKNKRFSDYIYFIATLQCKVCLMSCL